MPSSKATSATERPVRLRLVGLGRLPETERARLMAAGKMVGHALEVSVENYRQICQPALRPPPPNPSPVPWPIWARLVRSRRTAGDRGVGDTVERTIGIFGSDDFRFWHYCVFGSRKPCPACPSKWNRAFPYEALTGG